MTKAELGLQEGAADVAGTDLESPGSTPSPSYVSHDISTLKFHVQKFVVGEGENRKTLLRDISESIIAV
jgi:hypothetical protein